jgi:hypothetical protein
MRTYTHSHLGLLIVLLLVFTAGLGLYSSSRGLAHAASPHLWLSQMVGPPTAVLQAHGYGFGPGETVLVNFSSTQVETTTTGVTGKFLAQITVPKWALPGMHRVQASGQSSGLVARAFFLVRTDWPKPVSGHNTPGITAMKMSLHPPTCRH